FWNIPVWPERGSSSTPHVAPTPSMVIEPELTTSPVVPQVVAAPASEASVTAKVPELCTVTEPTPVGSGAVTLKDPSFSKIAVGSDSAVNAESAKAATPNCPAEDVARVIEPWLVRVPP